MKYMYLIPQLDDMLHQLVSFRMFYKTDPKSSSYKIKIKSRHEWKTTFKMHHVLYVSEPNFDLPFLYFSNKNIKAKNIVSFW
jgi:hypothetical protein